jgi:hypothetical protein
VKTGAVQLTHGELHTQTGGTTLLDGTTDKGDTFEIVTSHMDAGM